MTTKTGKRLKELEDLCFNKGWEFSVSWREIDDYSVEIYTGYEIYVEKAKSLYKAIKKGVRLAEKLQKQ